jgi:hypothetical protein
VCLIAIDIAISYAAARQGFHAYAATHPTNKKAI